MSLAGDDRLGSKWHLDRLNDGAARLVVRRPGGDSMSLKYRAEEVCKAVGVRP